MHTALLTAIVGATIHRQVQNDTAAVGVGRGVYYTAAGPAATGGRPAVVYAFVMGWPRSGAGGGAPTLSLLAPRPSAEAVVTLLGGSPLLSPALCFNPCRTFHLSRQSARYNRAGERTSAD